MPRIPASKMKAVRPLPTEDPPESIDQGAVATIDPPEPPAAPPEPIEPPPPASALIQEEIERDRRLARVREELVQRRHALLARGGDLSVGETRLLQTALPKSPHETDFAYGERFNQFLNREEARVSKIVELQAAAGMPGDRETADKLAEKTAETLETEAPPIEEQIRQLQRQLDELRSAAANTKAAAAARHAAVVALKDEKLLPGFVKDELVAARRANEVDFGGELRQLESRRVQITGTLAVDVETPEGREVAKHHVQGNKRFGVDEFERLRYMFQCSETREGPLIGIKVGAMRPERWQAYCSELRRELAATETRIAELAGGKQVDADAAIEKLRSFYVRA